MPFVRTFEEVSPPERFDEVAFTEVTIEEAASADGPWTQIDLVTLDPVDDDPADPQERSVTTPLAALDPGWYRLGWRDAAATVSYSPPVRMPGAEYVPAVGDVGALLRARTKSGMDEVGTFDATTRPTGTQVETLIAQAVADVQMRVGANVPDELVAAAKHVVTLRAAQLIELSLFPEQQEGGGQLSPYQTLRLSYEEALDKLVKAVQIRSLFGETLEETASA